jgi:deoxycytidine triphosphate deaminase
MSLLSYTELLELQKAGVITNSLPEHVNSTSIDITLGNKILYESRNEHVVDIRKRESLLGMREWMFADADDDYYSLEPGEFILAQSEQVFNLPDWISAEYKLKSSLARTGVDHANAGWCDAGWHGSVLTLELKNMTRRHTVKLRQGDKIGQMVFFKHTSVPEWASYAKRGRYNGDVSTQGVKP